MGTGTQRLYESAPYLKQFNASVLSCQADGAGRFAAVLDRTAFYPEGGGQPGDTGLLGGVRVLDTREKDGEIRHLLAAPLEKGAWVTGVLDWRRRFSNMQRHTAEHILSGLARRLYGAENVCFHMGREATTMDFSVPLSAEETARLELLANRAAAQDLPVEILYPAREELAGFAYRSKKEIAGQVRLVRIGEVDLCACCGVHAARTGEVGLIKIVSAQRYKGGVRIGMLCGEQALDDYRRKQEENAKISALLSAKPGELAAAAERLKEENRSLRLQYDGLLLASLRRKAASAGRSGPVLVCFEDGLSPDLCRQYCLMLLEAHGGTAAAFSPGADGRMNYALASADADLRELSKRMNAALAGRGGGKPGLVQGSLEAGREEIEAFFSALPA